MKCLKVFLYFCVVFFFQSTPWYCPTKLDCLHVSVAIKISHLCACECWFIIRHAYTRPQLLWCVFKVLLVSNGRANAKGEESCFLWWTSPPSSLTQLTWKISAAVTSWPFKPIKFRLAVVVTRHEGGSVVQWNSKGTSVCGVTWFTLS